MNKPITLLLTLLTILTAYSSSLIAQDQQATYDLRPATWKANQTTRYEFWNRRDRNINMSFAGDSRDSTDAYESTGETTWIVDRVNADGSSTCRMKIDWLKITLIGPTGDEVAVDSRENNPAPYEEYGNLLKAMCSAWLTYEIGADGSVNSVSGMDQMVSQVDNPDDLPTELDFIESASDLAQLIGPPPALVIGGSWQHDFRWSYNVGLPGVKAFMNYDMDFTLTNVEDIETIPVATVDGTGSMTLEIDQASIPAEAPPVNIRLINSSLQSQVLFDLTRSEAVGRNLSQDETINITISTPNGELLQVIQTKHQGQVLRLSEE
ncbi:hypothetical protein KS4_35230 [Poriferisphaera corsica]|uniref:Uncharacterized protein n=1 Tax=Poriferisphaera corsica TaxID=2528020 RepID=A0A517YYY9_9BACT|nr:hypothetical protein [Poriferisphaera corsica]QDU35442.1 hypothetical protein KS4_35230 [Poriferisphaera corsica]